MIVLEVPHKNAENTSRPRQEVGSTVLCAIPYRIVIGPVPQSVTVRIMGPYGIETELPSPNRPEQNS